MKRREFIKASSSAAAISVLPSTRLWASPSLYSGEFLIQVQVGGAWDVSSYCDPKKIPRYNNWAKTKNIKRAGRIQYAPWANNPIFFDTHYNKILVINGVNCFTNGHSSGRRYNFTGSNQSGYPSLSAAFAATQQNDFPMPLLVNGGQFSSGNLIVPTRVGKDVNTFNTLLEPNLHKNKKLVADEDLATIDAFRKQRALRAKNQASITARRAFINNFVAANKHFPNFNKFQEVLKSVDTKNYDMNEKFNVQMLYALVAFKAGLSISADTVLSGFDTHDNHDVRHEPRLSVLNEGLMFVWDLAKQLGIEQRLNLFIASDFARTPKYNDGGGKDHWPIGSTIIMKAGVNWTNRVVGKTTSEQKAEKLNPTTLEVDHSTDGVVVEPNHVMAFGRKIMGIDNHPLLKPYDLRVETPIDFSGGRL